MKQIHICMAKLTAGTLFWSSVCLKKLAIRGPNLPMRKTWFIVRTRQITLRIIGISLKLFSN